MSDSQTYLIPDVPLIAQTNNMACWYASAQMLIRWRQQRTLMCEIAHPDPSQVPALQAQFLSNDGLPLGKVRELAQALGLKEVPPMTPSPGAIATMLQTYGPLWFAGFHPSGHVVVITGITSEGVIVNDPWPPNQGTVRGINFGKFGQINSPIEHSGDGSFMDLIKFKLGLKPADLSSNFLHFP